MIVIAQITYFSSSNPKANFPIWPYHINPLLCYQYQFNFVKRSLRNYKLTKFS